MAGARKLPYYNRVYLPFLLIIDRGIENYIFKYSINV